MRKLLLSAAIAVVLGVPQAQAASSNDQASDFLFRLGMLKGHLMVGHDLLQAGKTKLAMPHFGHPVRELYDDIKGYLDDNKIPSFESALVDLEDSAAKSADSPETEQRYQAVIAKVEQARQSTPVAVRDSVPAMIEICADTIDAAAGEYGEAINKGRIEEVAEYHDSHGYISAVQAQVDELAANHPSAADQSMIARFRAVLAKAQNIVGSLMPPEAPKQSVADYRRVAQEARAVAKN